MSFRCPIVTYALPAAADVLKEDRFIPIHVTTHCRRIRGKEARWKLSSGLVLHLEPRIDQLRRGDWESLTADKFFLHGEYLLGLERSAPANMRFHYALIYKKNKPLVAAYFQVIHLHNGLLMEILSPLAESRKYVGFLAGWREWMRKGFGELSLQVLVSGNNFVSGEHGLSWDKSVKPADAFNLLAEAVRVIIDTDRENGRIAAVLAKDYYPETLPAAQRLRRYRYHQFLVEPQMVVDCDPSWKTFEDYTAAMSKKYRNRAKAVLKKAQELKLRELGAAQIEAMEEKIMELYLNVHHRAKFRLSALSGKYFSEMKRRFGKKFRFVLYELNGRPAGFRTSFLTGDSLEAHFIGIDYSLNRDYALYQLMLYDYIREGIENRVPCVYLGRTASEIKSTVGARPQDLTCFIRHRNALSNQIIRPFIEYLKPSEWVQRNPFKEEAEAPSEVRHPAAVTQ